MIKKAERPTSKYLIRKLQIAKILIFFIFDLVKSVLFPDAIFIRYMSLE